MERPIHDDHPSPQLLTALLGKHENRLGEKTVTLKSLKLHLLPVKFLVYKQIWLLNFPLLCVYPQVSTSHLCMPIVGSGLASKLCVMSLIVLVAPPLSIRFSASAEKIDTLIDELWKQPSAVKLGSYIIQHSELRHSTAGRRGRYFWLEGDFKLVESNNSVTGFTSALRRPLRLGLILTRWLLVWKKPYKARSKLGNTGNFSHTPPKNISVVLTLVAAGAVEGPVAVGLAPCSSSRALHVVSTEGGVRGSGCVLAGVRVLLGEEGRVGPQLVPLEGKEGLARLLGRRVSDRGWTTGRQRWVKGAEKWSEVEAEMRRC